MNNSARWLVTLSLALLLVSGFSVRAEDQPMARAPLPPPLPVSPSEAQSSPSAATPETQRGAKPVASESVQTGNWKHDPIHRARISSSTPFRPVPQIKSSPASRWRARCPFPAHRRRSTGTILAIRRGTLRIRPHTNTLGRGVPLRRGRSYADGPVRFYFTAFSLFSPLVGKVLLGGLQSGTLALGTKCASRLAQRQYPQPTIASAWQRNRRFGALRGRVASRSWASDSATFR